MPTIAIIHIYQVSIRESLSPIINFVYPGRSEPILAKVDAKQFIFDEEYFMNFGGMDDAAYKQGFEGITSETWTGEQAIIATATMTSNAMKQSTTDAFESFATIKNGGAQ